MEGFPSAPPHVPNTGVRASNATHRAFHCPVSPNGMAGLGFLGLNQPGSSNECSRHTQESKLFHLIDILPDRGIDLVGVQYTTQSAASFNF